MITNAQEKIKILRIIARLNIGGPAIHTVLLTKGLNFKGFDSLLIAGQVDKAEGDMLYYAKENSVNPIIIPQLRRNINPLFDTVALIKILSIINKEKPDIIHTHTAKAGALGRIAGLLYNLFGFGKKCKIIHTFHGTVLQGYFGKTKTVIFAAIERFLSLFTDRIIVVSDSIKEELLSLGIGSRKKIEVVPLGLELDKLLAISKEADNQNLKIGIVGRLVPIKNHKMFLEAVRLFVDNSNSLAVKCSFYIIGDGELRQKLESYASSLNLNNFIKFCGWNQESRDIYSFLDIVVLTSLNEGTPLSLIEAMAAFCPVIATNVGGVKDLFYRANELGNNSGSRQLYDNGILCESGNVQALAEALKILVKDKDLRIKMAKEGRSFVSSRFSKERLINDMSVLYNNALKRSA